MKNVHLMKVPCTPVEGPTKLDQIPAPKGKDFVEVKYKISANMTITVVGLRVSGDREYLNLTLKESNRRLSIGSQAVITIEPVKLYKTVHYHKNESFPNPLVKYNYVKGSVTLKQSTKHNVGDQPETTPYVKLIEAFKC